jgi:hypothetical protein
MQLTIDNLTGAGALDYSSAVCLSGSDVPQLIVERKLNAPSTLRVTLALTGSRLPVPARQARVRVVSAAQAVLFTGYVVTEPQPAYAGADSIGAVYRLELMAISDEWLLDKQSAGQQVGPALGAVSGSFVKTLIRRTDAKRFVTYGVTSLRTVGAVALTEGAAWSNHVASVGNASHAAYRVLDGAVSFSSNGNTTHAFSEDDGSIVLSHLHTGSARELANDVSLTGIDGSSTYWTELFAGDGTTTTFNLTGEPTAANAGHTRLIAENFLSGFVDLNRWSVTDPGSHLSAGAAGFALSGGNGFDGQTTLTANDALELGGSIVFELKGISLAAGSAGVLAGLYAGATLQANCLAGFSVKQSGGSTVVMPLVSGVETGSAFTLVSGHVYTLRVRLMSRETVRVKQLYYAMIDGQVQAFGGGNTAAPLSLVFEARDEGASSNTPVTVLYDAVLPASPAVVSVVAVNCIQLFGSLSAINLTNAGTGWVRSTPSSTGITVTRDLGAPGQGADCMPIASVTGQITFFTGRQPAAGERVTVTYRGRRRAVARVADPVSIIREAAGGGVGTARWVGHVHSPPARSAEDCEAAAIAVLAFATNRGAATAGRCVAINPPGADLWPGDVLSLTANGSTVSSVIRQVAIESQGSGLFPGGEALAYTVTFASEWAEGIGLTLSETVPAGAQIPSLALNLLPGSPAAIAAHTLGNLQSLAVIGTSGAGSTAALNLDAGTDAPAGGGFEVRRRDAGFGNGAAELVLRSPVRGFAIPRSAAEETFFIRMYDASVPPLYSRESAAIVTHLPV